MKSVQDILAILTKQGVRDLDEVVHDVMSQQASSINNSGLEAQIQFLVDNGIDPRE